MSTWTAEIAEWYADKYGEYATNRMGIDALELDSDDVVVDIGCGTGAALRHATGVVAEGRLIGVDPVPRMVEIARERAADHPQGQRLELLVGTAADVPLTDGLADVVLALDSYDHWRDPPKGLAEVARLLRAGGRFAVVKDHGAPGGTAGCAAMVAKIERAGFRLLREAPLSEGAVACTLWVWTQP